MKKGWVALLFCLPVSAVFAQAFITPLISGTIRLTDSIACNPVEDQAQSPTCWVFGTNSLVETELIRQKGERVNLSEMFIARYAYIDKANRFLATGGKTYFEGGGQFHDVIRVLEAQGMVPEEVYPGLLPGQYRHQHDGLDSAMKQYVHALLKKGAVALDTAATRDLNDTLDKYLGRVPAQFLWQGKSYTPQSFAGEVVSFKNEFAELVSFANQRLYRPFILRDKYNWANDSFYNVQLMEMQELIDTALHNGYSVGWEGDVTEPGFNYVGGYASLPDGEHDYDSERLRNYADESTERDHMLHIVGSGYDASGKKWYYLKNSWGPFFSKYKGYLYMDENYLRMKTVILFVRKDALPEELRHKLYGQ